MTATPSAPSPLGTVQRLYAAFGQGDLPAILETLDPEVDWKYHGPSAIPFAGHFHGRAEMAGFFQRVAESTEIHAFDFKEFVERGDTVIVYGSERCTARHTGQSWQCDWVHIWTVAGGRVVRLREFYDTYDKTRAFLGTAGPAATAAAAGGAR